MTDLTLAPLLGSLEKVAPISDSERDVIAELDADIRYIPRRRLIAGLHYERPSLQIILSGWAARYVDRRNGVRRIVSFLLPGDCSDVDDVAANNGEGVVALTDCQVAYIDLEALEQTAPVAPNLIVAFWRMAARQHAVMRRWMTLSAKTDAAAALAHLLCELYFRAKNAGLAHDAKLDLPLTQEDLANALSLTSVHVNRSLRKLRESHLCILENRQLIVLDLPGLQNVGGFDPGYL